MNWTIAILRTPTLQRKVNHPAPARVLRRHKALRAVIPEAIAEKF
jgi:hypothetical protein